MASDKQSVAASSEKEREPFDFGSAIAMGVSLGMIFGLLFFDNVAMGMAGGLLLAGLANAYDEKKRNVKHANVALAISAAALFVYVVIWALMVLGHL